MTVVRCQGADDLSRDVHQITSLHPTAERERERERDREMYGESDFNTKSFSVSKFSYCTFHKQARIICKSTRPMAHI